VADHELLMVSGGDGARDGIAECSCGWRSDSCWSTEHATARWDFHVAQETTARRCAPAAAASVVARQRRSELTQARARVLQQRLTMTIQRQRLEIRRLPAWLALASVTRAARLEQARAFLELPLDQLWLDYVAIGGNADLDQLELMLDGTLAMSRRDHDRVGVVVNERFAAAGFGHPLSYWDAPR
jgi:hypothetical protein